MRLNRSALRLNATLTEKKEWGIGGKKIGEVDH
jgi:hypothetical protein